MIIIQRFFSWLFLLPAFIVTEIIDLFNYFRLKKYKEFHLFGLYIYIGMFGGGKTLSAVRRAYMLAKKYPNIEILTNVKLTGFPSTVVIRRLNSWEDIVNFKPASGGIVLIDEISTIFNSRDFKNGKALNKQLFQYLAQNRKNKLLFLGTAQFFEDVDIQIRRFVKEVVVCKTSFSSLDFGRMTTNTFFIGRDYELSRSNPVNIRPRPVGFQRFLQITKVRNLYDTFELIETLMEMNYDDDATILANQGRGDINIDTPLGRRDRGKLQKGARRAGLI